MNAAINADHSTRQQSFFPLFLSQHQLTGRQLNIRYQKMNNRMKNAIAPNKQAHPCDNFQPEPEAPTVCPIPCDELAR